MREAAPRRVSVNLLVIVAAFGWASANIVGKRAGPQDALAYIAWASLFAGPPLLLVRYSSAT